MRGVQKDAKWFLKIHRRLIKPPYPVKIPCPGCSHWLIEVNSDIVEISNDFGLPPRELKAVDVWMRIRHSCGTMVTLYWN
jgi:hypothetical protein